MSAVAVDYIWQAILESERSDDIQFVDDELQIKAEAACTAQPQRAQLGAVCQEPIAASANGLTLS